MSALHPTTPRFKQNARAALADPNIQAAMSHAQSGFVDKRAKARARLPEFDLLRDAARDLKDHTLANLALYLERYEAKVSTGPRRPRTPSASSSTSARAPAPPPSTRASR